jgi:hypothetical protein
MEYVCTSTVTSSDCIDNLVITELHNLCLRDAPFRKHSKTRLALYTMEVQDIVHGFNYSAVGCRQNATCRGALQFQPNSVVARIRFQMNLFRGGSSEHLVPRHL